MRAHRCFFLSVAVIILSALPVPPFARSGENKFKFDGAAVVNQQQTEKTATAERKDAAERTADAIVKNLETLAIEGIEITLTDQPGYRNGSILVPFQMAVGIEEYNALVPGIADALAEAAVERYSVTRRSSMVLRGSNSSHSFSIEKNPGESRYSDSDLQKRKLAAFDVCTGVQQSGRGVLTSWEVFLIPADVAESVRRKMNDLYTDRFISIVLLDAEGNEIRSGTREYPRLFFRNGIVPLVSQRSGSSMFRNVAASVSTAEIANESLKVSQDELARVADISFLPKSKREEERKRLAILAAKQEEERQRRIQEEIAYKKKMELERIAKERELEEKRKREAALALIRAEEERVQEEEARRRNAERRAERDRQFNTALGGLIAGAAVVLGVGAAVVQHNKQREPIEKTCAYCGKRFMAYPAGPLGIYERYCSTECYNAAEARAAGYRAERTMEDLSDTMEDMSKLDKKLGNAADDATRGKGLLETDRGHAARVRRAEEEQERLLKQRQRLSSQAAREAKEAEEALRDLKR